MASDAVDDHPLCFKRWLLCLFGVAWVVSCWNPPYPEELVLQHIPTVLALGALILIDRSYRLSMTSYIAFLAFLSLHVLGARYLYSNVPYEQWCRALLGLDPGADGRRRNHYDRLVHLSYGMLLVGFVRELLNGSLALSRMWSHALAVTTILASSAAYELLEWVIALLLAPAAAEAYNGQQGDMWDAQKDMALVGALLASSVAIVRERSRQA